MRLVISFFLILLFPGLLSAQNISYNQTDIAGRLSPFRVPVVPNKPAVNPKIKKISRLIVLDIPLMPKRRTVSIKRIKENNVFIGSAISPWEEEAEFYSITPEFGYFSKNIHFGISGGVSRNRSEDIQRKVTFVDANFESSLWVVLAGLDGFQENEKIPGAITGLQFRSSFTRTSIGGRGWLGLKLGNFSSNFVAVRYGRGYIKADGENSYLSSSMSGLEPVPIYSEEFLTESISVESKISSRRITGALYAEKNAYIRMIYSPDPLQYGWNDFNDLRVEGTIEFIPLLRKDFLRVLVRGTRYLESRDGLLFRNQPPELQVFLRIRFK